LITRLDISNYALIENVSLDLRPGFTVITGETGAGKSILLKAINLLLGERADTSVIRQNEKKCFLEAEFDLTALRLEAFFETNDLEFDNVCTVRREFSQSGKSRCFINDSPVQVSVLAKLGSKLINVHSQHETLQILDSRFQLEQIDYFAGIESEVRNYQTVYREFNAKTNQLRELSEKESLARKEEDYIRFLLQELDKAQLDGFLDENIEGKFNRIEHATKISSALNTASGLLENEQAGLIGAIERLTAIFSQLKTFDKKYSEIESRIQTVSIEMQDIYREISNATDETDLSPAEIQLIQDRMEFVNSLLYKHHLNGVNQLLELRESLIKRLGEIQSVEQDLLELSAAVEKLGAEVRHAASELSAKRKACSDSLAKKTAAKLVALAMPDARLKIEFNQIPQPGLYGVDDVQFMFRTNAGGSFSPLKKIASGGELSRLMLSLISVLSGSKKLPTMIFDEIDTGVSGEVASKIAAEFSSMGKKMQVIAVTHLAQVAGQGDHQLHVSKQSAQGKTTTTVAELDEKGRVNQIAQMISGEKVSKAAKENARLLMAFTGKKATQKRL